MESQAGDKVLEKAIQPKFPPPPPTQPLWADLTDYKRKKDKKNQYVAKGGKGPLAKEIEPQRGAKQAKVTQTLADRRGDS